MNNTSEGPIFIALSVLGGIMTLIILGGIVVFVRLARKHERERAERRAPGNSPGNAPKRDSADMSRNTR